MKILAFCPRIPSPPTDGGAQYVYYILKALADRGHQITLCCFESRNHVQETVEIGKWSKLHLRKLPKSSYSPFLILKSLISGLPAQVLRYSPKPEMLELLYEIQDTPDIILLEGIHACGWVPLISSRFKGTPVIIRESNVEWEILERRSDRAHFPFDLFWRWQSRLLKRFEIESLEKSSGFTAISESDRGKLAAVTKNRRSIAVSAGSSLSAEFQRSPSLGEILFLADFSWHPNILGLQWLKENVLPLIKDRSFRITIVGKGFTPHVEAIGKVELVYSGFVPDLAPYYMKSTAQIIVVEGGGGVKLRTLEALSLGMPLLINPYAAEGIDLTHGRECLVASTPSDFAQLLIRILDDSNLRNVLSHNARKFAAENFSWTKSAEKLEDFLIESIRLSH